MVLYSTVYSTLQNITNYIISEGNPIGAFFGGEICSSKQPIKMILVSIRKKGFQV